MIQLKTDSVGISSDLPHLLQRVRDAQKKTDAELLAFQSTAKSGLAKETDHLISKRKIVCNISKNGLATKTIHRLLLAHGGGKYLKNVPAAFFIGEPVK